MTGRHLGAALAVAALAAGGCLPRGDAPAGRQILADSTISLAEMLPPNGDGLMRVLFFRPDADAKHADLWVLSTDANGDNPTELKLSADFDAEAPMSYTPAAQSTWASGFGFGPSVRNNAAFLTDARGRIYLSQAGPSFQYTTLRIDPATGESRNLGEGGVSFSASAERVAVGSFAFPGQPPSTVMVYEADDTVTMVEALQFGFLGEDLYYLTGTGELMRSVAGGAQQVLATGVSDFTPIGQQGLLVVRGALPRSPLDPDPSDGSSPDQPATPLTQTILDTTTLQETPLPGGLPYQQYLQWSSDGRWFLATDQGQQVLVDLLTGTVERFDAPWSAVTWRPGHDELWGTCFSQDGTGIEAFFIVVKKPGQPLVTIPSAYLSRFTPDGAYWISPSRSLDDVIAEEVIGLADDPTGPRRPLVPKANSLVDVWPTGDGRVLVTSETDPNDQFHQYYAQVVDPNGGGTEFVGQRGYFAAVGTTHALGLFDVSFERGDLKSFDFATGKTTLLAPEFARAAVTDQAAGDNYSPGARIVYQFQARFPSPWDGLWLTPSP